MSILERWASLLLPLVPPGVALVLVVAVLLAANAFLQRRYRGKADGTFRTQLWMLGLTFAGLLVIVLFLPIAESSRNELLSLLGLLVSGIVALSSTTFVGNALAGIMLRAVKSFRGGDFVEVGGSFGRVSERGLFHVEIQTEERNLTTLPNLFMVSQPVTVIRQSGTIVSATVSLGYDVSRHVAEERLLAAAAAASLEDPFVHVLELGDFSVTYRISGLLTEVKSLLSVRSSLRATMLDELHEAGVEIVSPNFMNTRALTAKRRFIPPSSPAGRGATVAASVEDIVFDKAERAASIEKLRERADRIEKKLEAMDPSLEEERERLTREREALAERIEAAEKRSREKKRS